MGTAAAGLYIKTDLSLSVLTSSGVKNIEWPAQRGIIRPVQSDLALRVGSRSVDVRLRGGGGVSFSLLCLDVCVQS